jgi:hypothetical protein
LTDITTPDVPAELTDALAAETFDVFSFVAGSATPEKLQTIYTNNKAAHELAVILDDEKRREADKKNNKKKVDDLSIADEEDQLDEARVNELVAELEASKLIFELKGLAPAAMDALIKHEQATNPYVEGGENPEYNKAVNDKVYVKTIKSISKVDGTRAATLPNESNLEDFLKQFTADQRLALDNAIWEVSTLGGYFDQAVTADFS